MLDDTGFLAVVAVEVAEAVHLPSPMLEVPGALLLITRTPCFLLPGHGSQLLAVEERQEPLAEVRVVLARHKLAVAVAVAITPQPGVLAVLVLARAVAVAVVEALSTATEARVETAEMHKSRFGCSDNGY